MFKVGDNAFDKENAQSVIIISASENWGFVSYKVYNATTNKVYSLSAESVNAQPEKSDIGASFIKYILLLSKIKNETSSGVLSKLASGILPLPHQLHVLNRAISTNNIRYILADEVGLGKTIEAGLIIKELKTRGLIRRVLVVCPTGLVTQWHMEMREKFGERFNIILPDDYDTIRKLSDTEDIYGQFNQVISPMDSIKPLEKRLGWDADRIKKYNEERIYSIINGGWDLIVIDEAHRVAGSSGEVARHKLGKLLSQACPYLLLLSATPHSGKTEPFMRLIRLVDEKAFPSFQAVVKEQVAPYVIRTEKRDAIDASGNKLFKGRTTRTVRLEWDERHTLQKELYKRITEYVAKNYNKALRLLGKNSWIVFLLIMMQRLVTSSTRAIRESMERRVKILQDVDKSLSKSTISDEAFADAELEENMDAALEAFAINNKEEIAILSDLIEIAKQAEYQYIDVKVEPLLHLIGDLFVEEKERKIIIFTEFVATQKYLEELLTKQGYTVSLLNGSLSIEERNTVLQEFKTRTSILISTDAGGEGLNLQFSNCVINYDLPWNPMKIEQRIGRVDRIGQTRDVTAVNFVLSDTVESRVKEVLEAKLSTILTELGVDKYSDVLDSEATSVNFTDAYMSSLQHPRGVEKIIKPIEDNIRRQLQSAAETRELIREEKDLTAYVGADMSFDLEYALRNMLSYYQDAIECPPLPLQNFGINDSIVTEHLRKEVEQDLTRPIASVAIKDLGNEVGYFALWKLSIAHDDRGIKYMPIFINDDFILRPIAGGKIWDAILNEHNQLTVKNGECIDAAIWAQIATASKEFALETFLAMKAEFERRNEESYRKQMYALNLRADAAQRIGIENIKKAKLAEVAREREEINKNYAAGKRICPEFKPVIVIRMEQ